MKRILPIFLTVAVAAQLANAQTIVSTNPENMHAFLEDFSGIHCGFCPDGHKVADQLLAANPGKVIAIGVHQGGYANPGAGEPDFRTDWADAIANQTSLTGYPAGTVNRTDFTAQGWDMGGGTAMGRGSWSNAINSILGTPSPVNLAISSSINMGTGELVVDVEVYYTGNGVGSSNKLNVGLMQSGIEGPQSGGSSWYPEMVLPNGNYIHNHVMRDLITGQWGEDLPQVTAGTFVSKQYTYQIPADYRGVPTVLEDIEVFAYITETTQGGFTGVSEHPSFSSSFQVDAATKNLKIDDVICDNNVSPMVTLFNGGNATLTSAELFVNINDEFHYTHYWTGSLETGKSEDVTVGPFDFNLKTSNTISIKVQNLNAGADEKADNDEVTGAFTKSKAADDATINLEIVPDDWGSEITWEFIGPDGSVIESGGPYANNDYTPITKSWTVTDGCYKFNISDAFGDGLSDGNNGNAGYWLTTGSGATLAANVNYGTGEATPFRHGADPDDIGSNVGINEVSNMINNMTVYPNPFTVSANINFNLAEATSTRVNVYNMLGDIISSTDHGTLGAGNHTITVSGDNLTSGMYLIGVVTGDQTVVHKVTLMK